MEGLSLLADGELFAVDVTLVGRVVRRIPYTPVLAAPSSVVGIAGLNGGIITLLSLSELLGHPRSASAVNAIIFKAMTNGNDQMGLLVDKPGSLISINDDEIIPPYFSESDEKVSFVTGMAEIGDKLYRIIDIYSIINRFVEGRDRFNHAN